MIDKVARVMILILLIITGMLFIEITDTRVQLAQAQQRITTYETHIDNASSIRR
jgi:cell division protein FtsL